MTLGKQLASTDKDMKNKQKIEEFSWIFMFRYKNLNKSTQKDKFAPDIDGNDAADLTAEETLHTFKSLLCRNKLNHSNQYCIIRIINSNPSCLKTHAKEEKVPCQMLCFCIEKL